MSNYTSIFVVNINNFIESIERNKETRLLSSVIRGVNSVSRDHLIKVAFHDEFVTPCVAGKKFAIVSETGDVFPCEILDEKIGNIKNADYNLTKILKSHESKRIQKWIKDTKCKCTFECASAASIVWNYKNYLDMLAQLG